MKTCARCFVTLFLLALATAAFAEPPLPAALQNMPRYPGATVVSTMEVENNVNAMFQASASPSEIIDFFNGKLPAQGWNKTMEARQDDGAMAAYVQGQKQLTVGVSNEGGGKVNYTLIMAGS